MVLSFHLAQNLFLLLVTVTGVQPGWRSLPSHPADNACPLKAPTGCLPHARNSQLNMNTVITTYSPSPRWTRADLLLVAKGNSFWLMVSRNFLPAEWVWDYHLSRALQTAEATGEKEGNRKTIKVPAAAAAKTLWEFVSDRSCLPVQNKVKTKQNKKFIKLFQIRLYKTPCSFSHATVILVRQISFNVFIRRKGSERDLHKTCLSVPGMQADLSALPWLWEQFPLPGSYTSEDMEAFLCALEMLFSRFILLVFSSNMLICLFLGLLYIK